MCPHSAPSLDDLLEDITSARAAEHACRTRVGGSDEVLRSARLDVLSALERYAEALEHRCWPVPRAILLDLNLHRSLCGTQRRSQT